MNTIKMGSMRKMMKKLLLPALLTLAVLLLVSAPLTAMAADSRDGEQFLYDMAMPVYTATVKLQDIVASDGMDLTMTVKLDSGVLDVGVDPICNFFGGGTDPLSPSDFLKRYQNEEITIDFVEVTQGVYSVQECRAGTK